MTLSRRLNEIIHDPARVLTFLFFPVYLLVWFGVTQRLSGPEWFLHCGLDDLIPFCEVFIIPYVLWYIYFGGGILYFLLTSRRDYLRLALMLIFGILVAVAIFVLKPNGIAFRPETLPRDNIFSRMVLIIYSIDPPQSVFPSLHCYVAICVTCAVFKSEQFSGRWVIKLCCAVFAALVCLSTVFIKQHSALDFFGAVALSVPAFIFAFVIKWKFIERARPDFLI